MWKNIGGCLLVRWAGNLPGTPAGAGREEALAAHGGQGEQREPCLFSAAERSEVSSSGSESCRGARGGSDGAMKRSCLVNRSGRQVR